MYRGEVLLEKKNQKKLWTTTKVLLNVSNKKKKKTFCAKLINCIAYIKCIGTAGDGDRKEKGSARQVSALSLPLRHISWRRTAASRRSPPWCPSWWSADTGASAAFHSRRWPNPAGLREACTRARTHTHHKNQNQKPLSSLEDSMLRNVRCCSPAWCLENVKI